MSQLNPNIINPAYVQISKKEAATILGVGTRTFDMYRANDPDCPKGFKDTDLNTAPVKFRLSDIYTYSQVRMAKSVEASVG